MNTLTGSHDASPAWRRRLVWPLTIFILICVAPALPGQADVAGVVVDEERRPVAGARVAAYIHDEVHDDNFRAGYRQAPPEARTDAQGRFTISGLREGRHQLVIEAEEYALGLSAAFTHRRGAALEPMKVVIGKGASLSGRVLIEGDGAPRPADGAIVNLSAVGGLRLKGLSRECVVAEDGSFEFRHLPFGVKIQFYASLFALRSTESPTLILSRENPRNTYEFRLPAGNGLIRGRVVDPAGEPVAGAEIFLGGTRINPAGKIVADAAGRFVMRHLERDRQYNLVARGPRYPDYEIRGISAADEAEVVFPLGRSLSFGGRVLRAENKQPAAGVELILSTYHLSGPLRATTDASGAFRFEGLRWIVEGGRPVFPPCEIRGAKHEPDDALVVGRRRRLVITPEMEALELLAERPATVKGRVIDKENGRPAPDAVVNASDNLSVLTDANGRFEVTGLPSGKIVIFTEKKGYFRVGDAVELTVKAGETRADIEIALLAAGVIRGVVLGPDGKPLRNATLVSSHGEGGHSCICDASLSTDGDGRFEIQNLGRQKFQLEVYPSLDRLYWAAAEADLSAKGEAELTLRLQRAQTISGKILRDKGAPPVSLQVRKLGGSGHSFARGCNHRGIGAPKPDEFVAFFSGPGEYELGLTINHGMPLEGTAKRVTLEPGESVKGVKLIVAPGKWSIFRGKLLGADRRPMSHCGVQVKWAEEKQGMEQITDMRSAQSSANGDFRFDWMPADRAFHLEIEHQLAPGHVYRFRTRELKVTETAPGGEPLTFILPPKKSAIKGRLIVRDAGKPITLASIGIRGKGSAQAAPEGASCHLVRAEWHADAPGFFEGGAFSFAGLPAGEYKLTFGAANLMFREMPGIKLEAGETIDLGDIALTVSNLYRLSGRLVRQDTKQPIVKTREDEWFQLVGYSAAGAFVQLKTDGPDAGGRFTISAPAAVTRLRIRSERFYRTYAEGIVYDESNTAKMGDVALETGHIVRMRLVDEATGEPVSATEHAYAMAFPGVDGSTFTSLHFKAGERPGEYHLPKYPRRQFERLVLRDENFLEKKLSDVTLSAGPVTDLGDVPVSRGGDFTVRLIDGETGEPFALPHAKHLRNVPLLQALASGPKGVLAKATVKILDKEAGRFSLSGIPAKAKTLTLLPNTFLPFEVDLTQIKDRDLGERRLSRGCRLRGRFVDADTQFAIHLEDVNYIFISAMNAAGRRQSLSLAQREDGGFMITGVAADRVKLVFRATGYINQTLDGLTLVENGVLELGAVPLDRGLTLKLRLLDGATGKPFDKQLQGSVRLKLKTDGGTLNGALDLDVDGRGVVETVSPNFTRLELTAAGFEPIVFEQLPPAKDKSVELGDIRLQPLGAPDPL